MLYFLTCEKTYQFVKTIQNEDCHLDLRWVTSVDAYRMFTQSLFIGILYIPVLCVFLYQ